MHALIKTDTKSYTLSFTVVVTWEMKINKLYVHENEYVNVFVLYIQFKVNNVTSHRFVECCPINIILEKLCTKYYICGLIVKLLT